MKSLKQFFFISSIFMSLIAAAQVPQQINYQAVARNATGAVLSNQAVSVRFTIHDASTTGTNVYQETQTGLTTNQFGLFTTAIGTGTQVGSNTFSSINWGTNSKYLQVEIDPTGGTSYADMGTTQLNAVPYALNSASSDQWYTSANDIYNLNTNTTHISGTPSGTTLRIDNSGAQDIAQFHNHTNSYVGYIGVKDDTTGMDVGTANGNNTGTFNLVTDGTRRVTINHTGLVGIGTTTPAAQLDISPASGVKALHITGLTAGGNSEQILTINTTTGVVDSTHLLHFIGENYGGGMVFYVYDNGLHGLIVSSTDLSTGIQWYNGTNTTTNATRDGVNAGMSNTERIIINQGAGSYAAQICANNQWGFSDWYLPSIDELAYIYSNIGPGASGANYNIGGFNGSDYYWSSTEYTSSQAWYYGLGSSLNGYDVKSRSYYVRAVRSF